MYGDSNVINIKNLYAFYPDPMFGLLGAPTMYASNNTINFTDYVYAVSNYQGAYLSLLPVQHTKLNMNYSTATWDMAGTITGAHVYGMSGELTFRPPGTVYASRRASTNPARPTTRVTFAGNIAGPQKFSIDTANVSLGVAASTALSATGSPFASSASAGTNYITDIKKPMIVTVEFATQANSANMVGIVASTPVNVLQTYRDGSWDPIEILGIKASYSATAATATTLPNVFRDTLTVRTTGPSLKSLLTSRTAAYWINPFVPAGGTGEKGASYKNIKVPIVSGSNYTITGYIRSNYASSTTGDVIMSVIYNNTVLATQNMTSAMYNSWEQFTLSFTASATGEAYLVWEMYYPSGGMSYWLDDLSIVKS
jgi:hypothetical protein